MAMKLSIHHNFIMKITHIAYIVIVEIRKLYSMTLVNYMDPTTSIRLSLSFWIMQMILKSSSLTVS